MKTVRSTMRLGDPVTLRDCPPGLFLFGKTLGLKTEYGAMETVGPVHIRGDDIRWRVGTGLEVYVGQSGEVFWGGVRTKAAREALMVRPVVAIVLETAPLRALHPLRKEVVASATAAALAAAADAAAAFTTLSREAFVEAAIQAAIEHAMGESE
ncbi:MAG: hypothetical protein KA105_02710 [Caulobacter sp.]|nr:hypothetical protein [Caulobacter sp.]